MGSFGSVIPVTGLNLGFPGQVSRTGDMVIAARQVYSSAAHSISFGQAVVLLGDSLGGTYESAADYIAVPHTFTSALFAGIAIREVKTNVTSYLGMEQTGSNTPVVGYYAAGEMAEVLERGSITVQINAGIPVAGNNVYLRTALNGSIPAGVVGGLEAQTVGDGGLVSLSNVVFRTGVLDANNVAEITILNRVAA